MKRVKLIVAYDGTNYHGWQIQPNGITIESELNRCLKDLLGEDIKVIGASRTDAGVHALCNVAIFDTQARMPGEKISYALNQRLPEDIRIQRSEEVPLDWHPRYRHSVKTYQYHIYCAEFPLPTVRLYSHFTYYHLNTEWMQEACQYFMGEHDFKSFCSARSSAETTVRTITGIHVEKQGDMITIEVSGTGFLYNMVRIIAGTLMEVGNGVYPPAHVKEIIEACDRQQAGPVAPARGLLLYSYDFLEE
ncbi:MAG: tRNA pseudouridine(38-40) synthase TruA [Lachnospiraceae bacterium]|nr:tRNA pseudouridine(38-40) synthase TruA [Lachnospiraceae bacterium]